MNKKTYLNFFTTLPNTQTYTVSSDEKFISLKEIWEKLPYFQQQSDRNVANIQEAVKKAALISIQLADMLSNAKATYTKLHMEFLAQQVDSVALLSHISHELARHVL